MKAKWIRILALMLCLMIPFTCAAAATDMGMPPDGMMPMGGMEPPGGFGGGMDMSPGAGGGGAPPADGAPTEAAIVITDGAENPDAEYEPGKYSDLISVEDGVVTIDGLNMESGDFTFNGLVATGSTVRLQKATIRLGVDSPASDDMTGGAAVNIDNGTVMYISDSDLVVDGSARYVTAAYNDATLIVNNSSVTSTGSNENTAEVSEPFSNEALLISGNARANFSIGATKTYYFNSVCTAEGWAALSTDSATGNGLDLYAYNTEGIAENGGYSTYADTNCRVWLYGSRLTAAEIACIISKSGQIHAYNASAADEELLAYNEGNTVEAETALMGGRNAVMIHAPDMMGQGIWAADCGTFTAEDTYIGTSSDLISTKNYYDYGEAVGQYVDYVSGDIFLIRSTSANIDLKNVTMESFNNVLVHTVLNSDSMGNFLAAGDGAQVNPIAVTMTDMDVSGDILHEDYQRNMTVNLENTTLSGNIVSGTVDSWNEKWTQYGEVNWVVDESYDAVYGVALTLGEGAVWNVTGESSLTSLTVSEGAVINGDITLDGEALTVEPGQTYTGEILVSGDYVPTPVEPEEASVAETSVVDEPEEPSVPAQEEAPAEAPVAEEAPSVEEAPAETAESTSTTVIIGVLAAVVVVALIAVLVVRKKKK